MVMQFGSPRGRVAAAESYRKQQRGGGGWMVRRMLAWAIALLVLEVLFGVWLWLR